MFNSGLKSKTIRNISNILKLKEICLTYDIHYNEFTIN